ncbi:hypothetical protein [Rhodobacter sp. NSM]|uniref:hypothetical protein n=1 Tax=Rhodobacter sp. NSM TaxID=3457501 RepID=UPI003FCEF44C
MSASEKDLEKQKRRHRGPLIGIAVVLVFALGYLIWWLGYEAVEGNAPRDADVLIDGRSGETEADPARGSVGDGPVGADNAPAPPTTAPAD